MHMHTIMHLRRSRARLAIYSANLKEVVVVWLAGWLAVYYYLIVVRTSTSYLSVTYYCAVSNIIMIHDIC
jgi:hypothetical protein